jgi:hypothetical protein
VAALKTMLTDSVPSGHTRRAYAKAFDDLSHPCILAQFRLCESPYRSASFRTTLQSQQVSKRRRALESCIDVIVRPSKRGDFETHKMQPGKGPQ